MTTDQSIDAALDSVLKASGSAIKHYTLPKTLADMRDAMRAYAQQERASERARCAAICAELATSTASMFRHSHDAKNANATAMMCHDFILGETR